ncbi:hypothetical protein RND81_04G154300 [Saponaria officinalis]|uniref:Uncharacterized protein n=1 Tax=Saponaria officinalis TaxID=3572 RepID=A0AAW1LMF4_SAPOF
MTNQITVKSSPAATTRCRHRRQTTTPAKSNVGEVAGETTAGICVVCCCCPCVLFECLILAVYKVPANVVRRTRLMIKKKNNKLRGAHPSQQVVGSTDELSDDDWLEFEKIQVSIDGSADAVELDKQMWDRFKDAGFWRTPSQRFD